MKTWNGIDKHSDAVVVFSAETEKDAEQRLKEIVKYPMDWYLDCVDENEDG